MGISYIIGQMNSPVNQLITFFRGLQDAKLSLERLNEIQRHPEEEMMNKEQIIIQNNKDTLAITNNENGNENGIKIKNLFFNTRDLIHRLY